MPEEVKPQPTTPPQVARLAPAKPKKAAEPTHYLVLHTQVGGWRVGEVIPAESLAGIDVQRLIDLGAISATDAPETDED